MKKAIMIVVACIFAVLCFLIDGALPAALICGLLFILPVWLFKRGADAMRPSEMICPNCGCTDIWITNRTDGVTSNSTKHYNRSVVMPKYHAKVSRQTDTKINRTRVAMCRSCGFDYPYTTAQEVLSTQRMANSLWKVVPAIVAVCYVIGLVSCAADQATGTAPDDPQKSASIWNANYAELSDFDYYIDGDEITLKSYNGNENRVNIAPMYIVDGEAKRVVTLEGTFALKSVESVIVPEGVRSISGNAFNSCGITHLYLPSTLIDFDGWSYFHDAQKLCFGGTEEQWAELYTRDRSQLDVVQILFNVNAFELTQE